MRLWVLTRQLCVYLGPGVGEAGLTPSLGSFELRKERVKKHTQVHLGPFFGAGQEQRCPLDYEPLRSISDFRFLVDTVKKKHISYYHFNTVNIKITNEIFSIFDLC